MENSIEKYLFDLNESIHLEHGYGVFRENYIIERYSESLYKFLGNRINISFDQVVIEEDREAFISAANSLSEGEKRLVLRVMCADNTVRLIYCILKNPGVTSEGNPCYDGDFYEIPYVCETFPLRDSERTVTCQFMSLYGGYYIEYIRESDMFSLYEIEGKRKHYFYNGCLTDLAKKVLSNRHLNTVQTNEFQKFYSQLLVSKGYSKTKIDASVFGFENFDKKLSVVFNTIAEPTGEQIVIGLCHPSEISKTDKSIGLMEGSYDSGTGVLNKRAVHDYCLEAMSKPGANLYFAMIDIDDFKTINDTCGHLYGDQVLLRAANILTGIVADRGIVGRFGGDEFVILLTQPIDIEELNAIFASINRSMAWAADATLNKSITASIGISNYPKDASDYDTLFARADKALYVAKKGGKNRFVVYSESEHGEVKVDDDRGVNIKIDSSVNDLQKSKDVSRWLIEIQNKKVENLGELFENMCNMFRIDGISFYRGENLERFCAYGNYTNPIMSLKPCMSPDFLRYFDHENFCEVSSMLKIETAKEAYDLFTAQGNGKYIMGMECDKNNTPISVVSLDFFNRAPKFGTFDIALLRILVKTIAYNISLSR